eukprot:GFUD01012663.1.p1 GENE.GFUD01012663.1~~GFUD01012663.1.p1  ORF type:complete len:187 (+),score=39.47 GFUD01012663.1:25-561(+)
MEQRLFIIILQLGFSTQECFLGTLNKRPWSRVGYDVPHPGIVKEEILTVHDKTMQYSMVNYDDRSSISSTGLNLDTGIFTAPVKNSYLVALTAQLVNPAGNDKLFSYAQLFILKNGNLESLQHYLLVEMGKVGDLRVEVNMDKGDTLQVFVGHHVESKRIGSDRYDGFNLESVRFCIF